MNQILDYNPNKNSGKKSSGSDKIVKIFAIILAIFAVCLLGGGAYGLYKNQSKSEIPTEAATKAQINIEQKETTAIIKVTHDKIIEKLIYSWDEEKETTIKGSGESAMEEEISLFAGEHTLNIKVTDVEGNETAFQQSITSENGEDKLYPVIDLKVTEEKKLRITATDETAIDYVTYRWNNDEEQKVEVSEDEKKIEFDIEILRGNNDLTIVAVDKNMNTTTEVKSFAGVTKPDVKITISADKKLAKVEASHENGIKEIKLKVNNEDYIVELPAEDPTPKEISFDVELPNESSNVIKVTAISVDETETEATENVEIEEGNNNDEINISIKKSEQDETKASIKASCEAGIKEVKLNVNDVDYTVDLQGKTEPELSFDFDLVEGNNKFTLTIISVNGTEKQEKQEISR